MNNTELSDKLKLSADKRKENKAAYQKSEKGKAVIRRAYYRRRYKHMIGKIYITSAGCAFKVLKFYPSDYSYVIVFIDGIGSSPIKIKELLNLNLQEVKK